MGRTIFLPLLLIIAVLGIVGGIGIWIFSSYYFYQTNDALVEGKVVSVDASQPGTLTNLAVKAGDTVTAGQYLGTITPAGNSWTTMNITSPVNGTILETAAQGQILTSGFPIAFVRVPGVANVGVATVVAFVDESTIDKVRLGQQVDISIDAFGGTSYSGHVEQIVQEAASQLAQFAQIPSQDNASGNFTKVSQRVPVLITLDSGLTSDNLLPGLSAEVTIHLH
jgi:multidrug resistance efflux pump